MLQNFLKYKILKKNNFYICVAKFLKNMPGNRFAFPAPLTTGEREREKRRFILKGNLRLGNCIRCPGGCRLEA